MKVWTISGCTHDVGMWETEVYTTKEKAMKSFKVYAEDYEVEVDDDFFEEDKDRYVAYTVNCGVIVLQETEVQ